MRSTYYGAQFRFSIEVAMTAKLPLPLPRSCYSVNDLTDLCAEIYLLHLPGETNKELFCRAKKSINVQHSEKPHTSFFCARSFPLQLCSRSLNA